MPRCWRVQSDPKKKRGRRGLSSDSGGGDDRASAASAMDWKQLGQAVQTPSQLRSYLEDCKKWLIEPCDETEVDVNVRPMGWSLKRAQNTTALGIVEEEVLTDESFVCALCDVAQKSGHTICANPFTRAQYARVCDACIQTSKAESATHSQDDA